MRSPRRKTTIVPGPTQGTVVALHAHPDDEALFTGGTLAQLAAQGHRVVVVVATLGEAGLADEGIDQLGARRWRELHASARALGVARVEHLGYADSGLGAEGRAANAFADADVDKAAALLADILREEHADVLLGYDAAGGYGHPDHVQVHKVARRARELADTPLLLEATVDQDLFVPVLAILRAVARVAPLPQLPEGRHIFTPGRDITHVVDVREQLSAKRRALAAHASQGTGGPRTIRLLLALRWPLRQWVLGREWFVQVP
jgi:LmbE family N-acetylglucosaminyl deacetylase